MKEELKKNGNIILNAVIAISEQSKDSELDGRKLRKVKSQINRFAKYLKTSEEQAFLVANIFGLNYMKNEVDIDDLARHFDCSPLKLLQYSSDFNNLVSEKILVRTRKRHGTDIALGKYEFVINETLSECIVKNNIMQLEEKVKDANLFDILENVYALVEKRSDSEITTDELHEGIADIFKKHADQAFIIKVNHLKLTRIEKTVFMALCAEVVNCGDNGERLQRLGERVFDSDSRRYAFMKDVCNDRTDLTRKHLVRIETSNFRNDAELFLTDKILDDLFEDNADFFKEKSQDNKSLLKAKSINTKQLYYNADNEQAIHLIKDSLGKRNLNKLQKRLKDKKLPVGVNILFYGHPGTGKTETALQLARQTGRDVMQVDIASSKSMWFGESEKQIKRIFTSYKEACDKSKYVPILLFNEADAILGKRKASTDSNVAQTENAMQNILLEEMERNQGIIIATTNLNDNLDKAFDRRFLYKIEFQKPDEMAMINIWKSKLPGYKKHEYEVLAENFKLSGGQIDNVVRKVTTHEVIHNINTDLHALMDYCLDESEYRNNRKVKVGF